MTVILRPDAIAAMNKMRISLFLRVFVSSWQSFDPDRFE